MTVSWSVRSGTVVENFDLRWKVEDKQQPTTTSTDTVGSFTNHYTITGLSGFENALVVTSVNRAGRNSSAALTFSSNILADSATSPPGGSNDTNLGEIIGGAAGILIASFLVGILFTLGTIQTTRQCKKQRTEKGKNFIICKSKVLLYRNFQATSPASINKQSSMQ